MFGKACIKECIGACSDLPLTPPELKVMIPKMAQMLNHGRNSEMERIFDRRAFLKLAGLGTAALAGSLTSPMVSNAIDQGFYRTSQTKAMMGTFVNITVFNDSKDQSEDAVGRSFDFIKKMENEMTRFSGQSPVSFLNQQGTLRNPGPDLRRIIKLAFDIHRISGGAFDITVKPLIDAIQESFASSGKPPHDVQLNQLLSCVGMENLSFSSESLAFKRQGMGITLDGIAKGYITDRAADFLQSQGLQHILVNSGGDIRTIGGRGKGRAWRIAVRYPASEDYAAVVSLMDGAVATSGNYEVYFDRDKIFHHIVNPLSGRCPSNEQSVTTVCRSTVTADALSTAVFVMESNRGIALFEKLPGVEGMVISRNGAKHFSSGWKRLVV